MRHPRLFRFGVQAAVASTASEWEHKVARVEDLGYSILAVNDHFNEQLASVPALMAAAMLGRELQVGATVFGNDFKHPAVLAKEMASLDVLSGGRTFLGLGAGWLRSDYASTGIPYDRPGIRIERMTEAVAVLKGLFSGERFSFSGKHYSIEGLAGWPVPVQRPHPPILIGGGGRKILTVAGQEADIVGINVDLRGGEFGAYVRGGATAGPVDEKIAWVRDGAGDRFDALELNVCVFNVEVTENGDRVARALADANGSDPELVAETPNVLIGTVPGIVTTLERRRERYGISNILVPYPRIEQFAPVVEQLSGR